jgi:hypothetical protein
VVPIHATAGDSVSFNVHVLDWGNLSNPVITAQVRDLDGKNPQDFTVTPIADGGACVLFPAQTRTLFELGPTRGQVVVGGNSSRTWKGRYDVQISHDASMARTFVKGELTLEEDVTT